MAVPNYLSILCSAALGELQDACWGMLELLQEDRCLILNLYYLSEVFW